MKKVCDYCEEELIYRQIAAFRVNNKKDNKLFSPICWTCWKQYSCLQNDEAVHSMEFLKARGLRGCLEVGGERGIKTWLCLNCLEK